MKNQIIKKRTLSFTTAVSANDSVSDSENDPANKPIDNTENLLKRIQNEEGVIDCRIEENDLMLEYDLQKTSLEILLPDIEAELKNLNITLKNDFLQKFKTGFICFLETNQRDNIKYPSDWQLRWQNIYLALAEQARDNRDIKTTTNR